MLVGFIGAPCSGKTTTAARLFAELKDMGTPSEFITEKARTYIAWKRYEWMKASKEFSLNDSDQWYIASSQFQAELIMKEVCGTDSIVISDTSVLNSLLYMSDKYIESEIVQELAKRAVEQYDLLFVCGLVPRPLTVDHNRVHSEDQSRQLHEKLETLVKKFVPTNKLVQVEGPSDVRLHTTLSTTLGIFAGVPI